MQNLCFHTFTIWCQNLFHLGNYFLTTHPNNGSDCCWLAIVSYCVTPSFSRLNTSYWVHQHHSSSVYWWGASKAEISQSRVMSPTATSLSPSLRSPVWWLCVRQREKLFHSPGCAIAPACCVKARGYTSTVSLLHLVYFCCFYSGLKQVESLPNI